MIVTPKSPTSSALCPPPCTPSSAGSSLRRRTPIDKNFRQSSRKPFENPVESPYVSREDESKCPCPRAGDPDHECMKGNCSPCCAGVFPRSKVVSEIVTNGKPYKEIEAIINDNHMVIRMQRESLESEWEPPCDCIEDMNQGQMRLGGGGARSTPRQCGENVVFQTADDSRNSCNFGSESAGAGSRGEFKGQSCRTIEVFPHPAAEVEANDRSSSSRHEDLDSDKKSSKNKEKNDRLSEMAKIIETEENPNIFLLRIRKRSENNERKNNIDLEFRTPRPWRNIPKKLSNPKPPAPIAEPQQVEDKSPAKKGNKKKKRKK